MNRAFCMLLAAAGLFCGCGPSAPPPAKVDLTAEEWYPQTTKRLADMDRAARQLLDSGRAQEAAGLITAGQPLQTRLLSAPHPTLEAMEAIADLDRLYGKMLISNGYFGEARMLFQKNITRWKTWKPASAETGRRLEEARADIAECDRHMGG